MVEPAVSYLESTIPATLDELEARAEADSYQKGARRKEDSHRDGNKHGDKTKMQRWITI
jgi:hypothetical protein